MTLLNVDYKKAASKCDNIASTMEVTFPFLIHADQTGFIKGRFIIDLLEETKVDRSSRILLSIDFRTLELPIIHRVLQMYNFGVSFRRCIEICKNSESFHWLCFLHSSLYSLQSVCPTKSAKVILSKEFCFVETKLK